MILTASYGMSFSSWAFSRFVLIWVCLLICFVLYLVGITCLSLVEGSCGYTNEEYVSPSFPVIVNCQFLLRERMGLIGNTSISMELTECWWDQCCPSLGQVASVAESSWVQKWWNVQKSVCYSNPPHPLTLPKCSLNLGAGLGLNTQQLLLLSLLCLWVNLFPV